jgi:hypothetical protein
MSMMEKIKKRNESIIYVYFFFILVSFASSVLFFVLVNVKVQYFHSFKFKVYIINIIINIQYTKFTNNILNNTQFQHNKKFTIIFLY